MYKAQKPYTSLSGQEIVPQSIIRLSDMATIPFDPANTDYQQFLKYQSEGGKVYGADEEIPAEEQQ